MKYIVKSLIPPIILKILKKYSYKNKIYKSYADASKEILNNGYENTELIKNIITKTEFIKNKKFNNLVLDDIRIFVILFFLKDLKKINILDFGGAAGYYYYLFNYFYKIKNIIWNIIESKSFVNILNNYSLNADTNTLIYHEDINKFKNNVNNLDLIFCSCSLQYHQDPLSVLSDLCDLGSKYIYITRTPLIKGDKKEIYLQYSDLISNGPRVVNNKLKNVNISYPITFVCKSKFEKVLHEKYEIIFSMKEDQKIFNYKNKEIDLFGYFCKLKD